MPRAMSGKKHSREELRKGSASKNSSRDQLPRHEDIAEYPIAEMNPLLQRTQQPSHGKPPTYEEVSVIPESQALIGGHKQMEAEHGNGSESDHSRVLTSKDYQMSQNGLSGDKRETSV